MVRHGLAFSTVLLAFAALSVQAQTTGAVDVTGKWKFTYKSAGGVGPPSQTFTFQQRGSTVTGSTVFLLAQNGSVEQRPTVDIRNGTMKGDSLTFAIKLTYGGTEAFRLNYAAKVTGNTMRGVQSTPRGERQFTGKRARSSPPDRN